KACPDEGKAYCPDSGYWSHLCRICGHICELSVTSRSASARWKRSAPAREEECACEMEEVRACEGRGVRLRDGRGARLRGKRSAPARWKRSAPAMEEERAWLSMPEGACRPSIEQSGRSRRADCQFQIRIDVKADDERPLQSEPSIYMSL